MAIIRPASQLRSQRATVVGSAGRLIEGTGAAQAQDAAVVGQSTRSVSGSGAVAAGVHAALGQGTITKIGTGVLQSQDAAVVGQDSAGNDADFQSRATADGVRYATNFDDVYLDGQLDPARSGISTTQELDDEAFETPGGNQFDLHTGRKLSGNGALRMWRDPDDGGSTSASWSFRPDGDRSGVANGPVGVIRRHYVQISVYMSREFLAWRASDGSSPKIFKAYNDAFADGEIPIVNRKYSGFISAQMNNPTDQVQRIVSDNGLDPFLGDAKIYQPGIYPSGGFDNDTIIEALLKAGCIEDNSGLFAGAGGSYGYINGDEWLDLRSSIINNGGFPNSNAATLGVPWVMDGWTVLELFADFDASPKRFMMWAAPHGAPPTLLADSSGLLKEEDFVGGYHQLVVQSTSQSPEASRPVSYRWYDDIICSEKPIRFPGGYTLPGALDSQGTALEQFFDGLTSGQSANFAAGEQFATVGRDRDDLSWQTEWHRYPAEKKCYLFTKPQNDPDTWRLDEYDEETGNWTDWSSRGAGPTPSSLNTSGHIYGNSSINPNNGDLFLVPGNGGDLYWYDSDDGANGTWKVISLSALPGSTSHRNGIAYHPNLFGSGLGGVCIRTASSIWTWNETTNAVTQLASFTNNGGKEGAGIYHPVSDAVFLGSGDDADVIYRITPGPTLSARGNPPLNAQGGSGGSNMTILPHPDGTSKIIGIQNWDGSDTHYESDNDCNTFSNEGTHGLHNGGDKSIAGPFLVAYGGVWKISETDARGWKP